MQIETKYHGQLNILDRDIITFERGLPGFENESKFALLSLGEDSPFTILQSVQTPAVAFVTVSPFTFYKDYDIQLPDDVLEELDIRREEDVVLLVILTIREPFEQSTANLLAPIVINKHVKKGMQVVLSDPRYKIKHPLPSITPPERQEKASC
jgi:flagellar assembly factor FliW